jgi:hypothetical protein
MSSWPNSAEGIPDILAQLEPEELDVLAGMDRAEIAGLIERARSIQRPSRLQGPASLTARVTFTITYAADEEKDGKPGRILLRGAGPNPVEVEVDGNWQPVERGLALPDGYEGRGPGWWQNYSLTPTSGDYGPINHVRWNHLLSLFGVRHGPELSPEEFARLPEKALRSASRKPILLAYLLGSDSPLGPDNPVE